MIKVEILAMKYTKQKVVPENDFEEVYLQILRFCCPNNFAREQLISESIEAINKLTTFKGLHSRLLPIVLQNILKMNIAEFIYPEAIEYLKAETRKGVVEQLGKKKQLEELILLFESNDIPIILLKASAFNGIYYSEEYPRISNDIDILVKENDWGKAKKILLKKMDCLMPIQQKVFSDLYETSFIPKDSIGANVDLHKSLLHPFLFDINEKELWENSIVHPLYNSDKVRILSPEDTLNHLAVHAFKDMNFSAYNLVDTDRMFTSKLNLDKVINLTKKSGTQRPLFILLKNYSDVLNGRLLPKYLNLLAPNFLTEFTLLFLQKLSFKQRGLINKSYLYRIYQVASQFAFTDNVLKPLKLQYLFLNSFFSRKLFGAK
ncbi:nucleotidyltransferase family protein [Aliiglaciecola lipolytica]|uniref:nucleotidyltransferase family protein n=1 Tax=Aliiglaciecola lipolytica TaxID=477689 RepID=UPI001C08D522|nr:nucleotidyltransferase family protein [Aliiglaciecola lipolytica]MBU2880316.1 nucleotidyltransferase family protein [Aliiglaciecola lipolytica]